MADVFVTDEAQADLDAIDQFSLQEFGLNVADRYHADILVAFGFIAENPVTAPVFRKQPPVVRSWPCRSHRIYYIVDSQGISVIRVLHISMDKDRIIRAALRKTG